jgi:hypothetical protein
MEIKSQYYRKLSNKRNSIAAFDERKKIVYLALVHFLLLSLRGLLIRFSELLSSILYRKVCYDLMSLNN